jgi:hypothetical protein
MVTKNSSRDSNIYGMLNSDWEKGARLEFTRSSTESSWLGWISNNKKEEGIR